MLCASVGATNARVGIIENELNMMDKNMHELAAVTNQPNGLVHELARRVRDLERLAQESAARAASDHPSRRRAWLHGD